MDEKRAEHRLLCSELVDVSWTDHRGRQQEALANLEDISQSGVCLQLDDPVQLNTVLRIRHAKGELQGSVRYCLYREIGYFLGAEFLPGCQWWQEAFKPQHLLDLRTLVDRSARLAVRSSARNLGRR
jgi:hypothetical protein